MNRPSWVNLFLVCYERLTNPFHTHLPALQARQYMQMLPKEKQPVAGSEGAQYRKKQLAKQLPAHDQDPSKCHELSPKEVKEMEQFVKKYKSEALGVGDVKLPSEMNAQGDKLHSPAGDRNTPAAVLPKDKSAEPKKTQYVSSRIVALRSWMLPCLERFLPKRNEQGKENESKFSLDWPGRVMFGRSVWSYIFWLF